MPEQAINPNTFTGLKIPAQPIGDRDFVLGDEKNRLGGLGLQVINPSGDWASFIPFPQVQNKPGVFDTSDCTGYAYCRKLATRLNGMRYYGLLSNDFIQWAKDSGYIQTQNGKESFMFDPRVLGIMAGTNENGNWLQTVAQTAKVNGVVPAGTLPGPESCNNTQEYYNKDLITPDIIIKGQEFLKWIDLPYNWVPNNADTVIATLKSTPLYVALCTCGGWNTPPVNSCNQGDKTNHCVGQIANQVILDSYSPFIKQLSNDYAIPYRMQILAVERPHGVKKMIGYQVEGNQTVYVELAGKLVAVADWQAFVNMGGSSNTIITLNASQFAKYDVIKNVYFKNQ